MLMLAQTAVPDSSPRPDAMTNKILIASCYGSWFTEMICAMYVSLRGCTNSPCYTFFWGDTQTTTDYIITDALCTQLVSNYAIQEHHPLNSSNHLPLSITLNMPTKIAIPFTPEHLDWKKGLHDTSIALYVSSISDSLRPLIGKEYSDPSELEEEIKSVSEQICHTACFLCYPNFKSKKHRIRNPELQSLVQEMEAQFRFVLPNRAMCEWGYW